jgi:hypothetical protein
MKGVVSFSEGYHPFLVYTLQLNNMKTTRFFIGACLLTSVALFSSCEILQQLATTGIPNTSQGKVVYSDTEGLKEALTVGITNTVKRVNQPDGYAGDALLKILLPAEAAIITDNIKLIPGGEALIDDVVLRLNRAAEDAAASAAPIFIGAIKKMTFQDATAILFGQQTAATQYLKTNTSAQLVTAYKPIMTSSLDKDLVGGISANTAWNSLTTAFNKVANSTAGKVYGLKPVTTDLSTYATNKALDGLFLKVGQEEVNIRTNVAARVTPILKQVFAKLD